MACALLSACSNESQSSPTSPKFAIDSRAESSVTQFNQNSTHLKENYGRISKFLRDGEWHLALKEIEDCEEKWTSEGLVDSYLSERKSEALMGAGKFSEARQVLKDSGMLADKHFSLTEALLLATENQISNEQVTKLLQPHYKRMLASDNRWRKGPGKKMPPERNKYPLPYDRKSRIASVRVLRAIAAADDVVIERECREALAVVPEHPLASYYLCLVLERTGRQHEEFRYLTNVQNLPGKHGHDARRFLATRAQTKGRDSS